MFSGKSTVAAELAKLGCKVIDADKIAHEILQQISVRDEVVGLFGQTIRDSAGKIDRRKLARIVFDDGHKLSLLNSIIHPLVLERTEELIEEYGRQGQVKAIVLDMPLLVEVGWADRCDRLIFVDCDEQLRLDRARKTGSFDESEIKMRENFQNSLDSKVCLADNTIDNNSDVSTLVRQVADLFSNIVNSQ